MTILFLVLFVAWIIAHTKTSRKDAKLISKIHPYRRMMAFIMPKRNESIVFYDIYIKADQLLKYIEAKKKDLSCDVTHLLVSATSLAAMKVPQMNRFVSGYRLYQRDQVQITFSMKRKRLNKKAKISAVKLTVDPSMTFANICQKTSEKINVERSEKKTYADKEFDLLNILPRPLLRLGVSLLKTLDYYNLLPVSFTKNDPMYSSFFIANLGSLGMPPGYHHLYEWGNCPFFMMAGLIGDKPVVKDGVYVPQKTLHLRVTYDERIEDGFTANSGIEVVKTVLENPQEYLGCMKSDGSDQFTFSEICQKLNIK